MILLKLAHSLIVIALLLAILAFFLKRQYHLAREYLLVVVLSISKFLLFLIGIYVMSLDAGDDNSGLYSAIGSGICGYAANFWLKVFYPAELREKGIIVSDILVK